MNKQLKKISAIILGLFCIVGVAFAQSTSQTNLSYTPLEPLPGNNNVNYADIASYLNYLFPTLIAFGAFFAVVMITINGVRYMLSDVLTEKSLAMKRIRSSIWGLVLLLAAVLILNEINPQLLIFNLQSLGQVNPANNINNYGNGPSAS